MYYIIKHDFLIFLHIMLVMIVVFKSLTKMAKQKANFFHVYKYFRSFRCKFGDGKGLVQLFYSQSGQSGIHENWRSNLFWLLWRRKMIEMEQRKKCGLYNNWFTPTLWPTIFATIKKHRNFIITLNHL